jgi:CRISPR/Cas system-associated endoribonuclease Cas2
MAVYAVTYDLHNPGQNYEDVKKTLKSFGGWWKYYGSFWLIHTDNHNASDIRDEVNKVIDTGDHVFVIRVANEWAAYMNKDAYKWLHDH